MARPSRTQSVDGEWIETWQRAAEGLYIGANYHYLYGFNYEDFEPSARLATNAQGLLIVNPARRIPVSIVRTSSTDGSGFALDVGVAAIIKQWELGFGVNGIGNRMDWTNVTRRSYVLDSLFSEGEFNDFPAVRVADARIELPVDVRGHGAAFAFSLRFMHRSE